MLVSWLPMLPRSAAAKELRNSSERHMTGTDCGAGSSLQRQYMVTERNTSLKKACGSRSMQKEYYLTRVNSWFFGKKPRKAGKCSGIPLVLTSNRTLKTMLNGAIIVRFA